MLENIGIYNNNNYAYYIGLAKFTRAEKEPIMDSKDLFLHFQAGGETLAGALPFD